MPALAVPVDNKDSFVFPEKHLDRLRQTLPDVNELLLIGWRASEAMFMQELHEHLDGRADSLRGAIVDKATNPSDAGAETFWNMAGILNETNTSRYGGGFSHFLEQGQLEDFLRKTQ